MGKQRVESLDYLRGLMALSVMAYHYAQMAKWTEPTGFNGLVGIYAVSVFFILSGVSLGIVYTGKIDSGPSVLAFWLRRFFRIAPLFWLAITIAWGMNVWLGRHVPDAREAWLNYSLTFGFVAPYKVWTIGAWSIGVEIVFYALFPLILLRPRIAFGVACLCGLWFAFDGLTPARSLASQWTGYPLALNHLFLFAGGVALATSRPRMPWLVGLVSLAGFALYPAGDQADVVTGLSRIVFSACSFGLVYAVLHIQLPHWRPLAFLGEGCYSIYLLHPLVYLLFRPLGLDEWLRVPLAITLTLALSWMTYRRIEKPTMDLGARLARRISPSRRTSEAVAG